MEPLYYGHQGDRNKCPYYRGVSFREVGFIWISVSQGSSELSVIERCPYYRGVRKERFHCSKRKVRGNLDLLQVDLLSHIKKIFVASEASETSLVNKVLRSEREKRGRAATKRANFKGLLERLEDT